MSRTLYGARPGTVWNSCWIVLMLLPWLAPVFGWHALSTDEESPAADRTVLEQPARPILENPGKRDLARKSAINRCLAIYYMRPIDADELRPWSIMHGMLAYGQDSIIVSRGKMVYAVDYLCQNGNGKDLKLMAAPAGKLHLNTGNGVQGHDGQLLAMLAQSQVPRSQEIMVDGHRFAVDDLIRYEQLGCRSNTELTFRLIGLSYYLDSNDTWEDDTGDVWNISRLMGEEIRQPVNGAACGGSHRLMGLSHGLVNRIRQGHELNDSWLAAERLLAEYQTLALRWQNRDGSFSTEWFEESAADKSAKKRLYTTGHILEWLVFSLPDDRLTDPRIARAVDYLTHLMLSAPGYELDVGPRGHALHALLMYHQRMYGEPEYRDQIPGASELTGGVRPARDATPQEETENEGLFRGLFGRRR